METNNMNLQSIEDITKEQFALMVIDSFEETKSNGEKKRVKGIAERVASKFEEYKQEAIQFLKDTEELEKLLLRVDEKLKTIPNIGDKLAYIPEMVLLVRSYVIKEYTDISAAEIVAIIAALIYLVSPLDVLPDALPAIGILDDVLVAGIVLKWCDDDLKKYMSWLKNKQ